MERLTETDVIAINKLLEYAAIARANGRRCDAALHFKNQGGQYAVSLDAGAPGACFAVAYEFSIPEAIDRVLEQVSLADERDAPTDPAPPPLSSPHPDPLECIA
jgi:hypothetical protein